MKKIVAVLAATGVLMAAVAPAASADDAGGFATACIQINLADEGTGGNLGLATAQRIHDCIIT